MSSKQVPTTAGAGTKEKELLFYQAILLNMDKKPDVDWDEVAAITGYNKGLTASTRFGQLMRAARNNNPNLKPAANQGSASVSGSGSSTNITPARVTKARTPRKPKDTGAASKRRTTSKASESKLEVEVVADEAKTSKNETEEEEDIGVYYSSGEAGEELE